MPSEVSDLLDEIKISIAHGELEKAREIIGKLSSKEDLSIEERISCCLYEGIIYMKLGENNQADQILKVILKDDLTKLDALLMSAILTFKAELSWRMGRLADGLEAVIECERLFEKRGDSIPVDQQIKLKKRKGNLYQHGGILCWYSGELDRAQDYLECSLRIKRELGDSRGEASILNNIGLVCVSKGELDLAFEQYQYALAINKAIDDQENISKCINNIGIVHSLKGELDQALKCYQESLHIKEKLGTQQDIAMQLINIGVIYQYKGDITRSQDYYQESLDISEALDFKKEIALALNNLAGLHEIRGDLNLALDYLQRSLSMYLEVGMRQEVALCFLNLGEVFRKKGDFDDSMEYLKQSLAIYEELENKPLMTIVLQKFVELAYNLGDIDMGQTYFHKLEAIKKQMDNKGIDQRYLYSKALLLKQSKHLRDRVDAVEILEQVVSGEVIDHALSVDATIHLCDLLLAELKITGNEDLFTRIKSLTSQLLEFATNQYSHALLTETYLLQSKLALVELDMLTAEDLLSKASKIAEEKELKLLFLAITQERELLHTMMQKWERILTQNPSKKEMIELTGVDHLLERMIQKTVTEMLEVRGISETDPSRRRYRLTYLDTLEDPALPERNIHRVGIAQIGLSQEGDLFNEFYLERKAGLFGLRDEKIAFVQKKVQKMIMTAAKMNVNLLIFPELSVDLSYPRLYDCIQSLAQEYQMHIIPGSYHDMETERNLCTVLSPMGSLWEQEKHIPAVIHFKGKRITEGITGKKTLRCITIGKTPFGRIAIVICRDFLDIDLRVELKHADPPVDLIINPAFTPVTADFRAAHFDARRSIFAYCFFANIAEFGDSLIYTPEKERIERNIPAGEEGIITKDIDLFSLRSERKKWEKEQRNQRRFIQSTR